MTTTPILTHIRRIAEDACGFAVAVTRLPRHGEPDGIELRPADVHRIDGFVFAVLPAWQHTVYSVALGPYAEALLAHARDALATDRGTVISLVDKLESLGAETSLVLSGQSVDVRGGAIAAEDWTTLSLSVVHRSTHSDDNGQGPAAYVTNAFVPAWALACVLLVPAGAASSNREPLGTPGDAIGDVEGTKALVLSTRVERSPRNRAACIAIHGARCRVCGFDFGREYGEWGAGYIQVHHLAPLATLEAPTVVHPATDLVPLCANCHAMVHRTSPPLSPDQLKVVRETSREGYRP